MKKIIIVDENKKNNEFISTNLKATNYTVHSYDDTLEGIEAVASDAYDLLILHAEFFSELQVRLIKLARKIYPDIRILVLCTPFFKEVHFTNIESLVDQFLEPEVAKTTLAQYVHALLLNHAIREDSASKLYSEREGIVIDTKSRKVVKDDQEFKLTPIEFGLLEIFLKHKNQLLTREYILETIWPFSNNEETIRKVDVHIKNLRTKMNIYSISSVRGKGYQWAE